MCVGQVMEKHHCDQCKVLFKLARPGIQSQPKRQTITKTMSKSINVGKQQTMQRNPDEHATHECHKQEAWQEIKTKQSRFRYKYSWLKRKDTQHMAILTLWQAQ